MCLFRIGQKYHVKKRKLDSPYATLRASWKKVTSSPRMINRRQWLLLPVAQGCRPKFPLSHILHTTDVAPCIPVTPCATAFPIRHSSGQSSWTAVPSDRTESNTACDELCNAGYVGNMLAAARNKWLDLLDSSVVRSATERELSGMQRFRSHSECLRSFVLPTPSTCGLEQNITATIGQRPHPSSCSCIFQVLSYKCFT